MSDDDEAARAIARAWTAYLAGEMKDAQRAASVACTVASDRGDAWYVRACCWERRGRLRVADRAFLRAARAPRHGHSAPYRVPWRRFEQAVETAADELDDDDRTALGEVDLILADHPTAGLVTSLKDPEPLGYFLGPRREDFQEGGIDPARIHLYRRSIEHRCLNAMDFADLVRHTLATQVAIYQGRFAEEA